MNKLLLTSLIALSALLPIQSYACDCSECPTTDEFTYEQITVKSYSVLQLREIEVMENTNRIIAFVLDDNDRHITLRIPFDDESFMIQEYANSIFTYDYVTDTLSIEYNSPSMNDTHLDEFGNLISIY
jgi:ssRNA-specific RNase YbeY (16S rRNA maturation enzyme)